MAQPVIGIICDIKDNQFLVGAKYVAAVMQGAGCTPLIIPPVEGALALLDKVDGVLGIGSPLHYTPALYGGGASQTPHNHDPARETHEIPLLQAIYERNIPFLGICRAAQGANIARGGSLFQIVQQVVGRRDHRSDKTRPPQERYDAAHDVALTADGFFSWLLDGVVLARVNSLHEQATDRLGEGLVVEAVAPDGTIEAKRAQGRRFFVTTQFHPEAAFDPALQVGPEKELYIRLFAAFGMAVRGALSLADMQALWREPFQARQSKTRVAPAPVPLTPQ